jgi:DNA-binding CsgD family transcriptional regulator
MDRFDGLLAATQAAPRSQAELRAMAATVAASVPASQWTVCGTARRGEAIRLVPIVDSATRGVCDLGRAVTQPAAEPFARDLMGSRLPAICGGARKNAPLPASRWLRRLDGPPAIGKGLAFPVSTQAGKTGAVLFAIEATAPADDLVASLHNACHAIFDAACSLRPLRTAGLPTMSGRELECLQLTARGLTSEQIAVRLGLSVHTANRYLSNTVQKLDATNRTHAVAKALRAGLID